MTTLPSIQIIGSGLAGSEAALQLAKRGFAVTLYDMKPTQRSAAHHNNHLAEIVCSNSFGSQNSSTDTTASGLLKEELTLLDCELLKIARSVAVPAGKALAVDREAFAARVTQAIQQEPRITLVAQNVTQLPKPTDHTLTLVATGPMTSPELTQAIANCLQREQLYFFDAAAPIVTRDSINFEIAFYQDRYAVEKQQAQENQPLEEVSGLPTGSYINCPLQKGDYEALVEQLLTSEKTELKSFEKDNARFFESCLPVEVLAARGPQTLRFGPLKPVGIVDPHHPEQRRPYAVVQLRQDNAEGTLYNLVGFQTNLKWGDQKQMIQRIPGLENAEIVRYGVMHRNTYIHSPEVLQPTLQLKTHPNILFAGQLTGTEGYTESIATGLLAALNLSRLVQGQTALTPPKTTMLGALLHYITRPEAMAMPFQPINSNWGILPELPTGSFPRKDKKARNRLYAERSKADLSQWLATQTLQPHAIG